MIEAVADAATGEFERLKEFGIRASKAGDEVTFTFRGVSTTVKNTAADVQQYLQTIGSVQFAGGLERQAATLDGSFSNLGDAWDRFQDRLLNDQGSKSVQLAYGSIATTLDFIYKEDGARTHHAALLGVGHNVAQSRNAIGHRAKGHELRLHVPGDEPCDGGLARAWRTPEENGARVAALNGHAEWHRGTNEVCLPRDLVERAWA
jgi:hypothetical protein